MAYQADIERSASSEERKYLQERECVMADLLALAEELETCPKTYLYSKEATVRTIAMMDRADKYMSPTKPKDSP